MYYQLVPRVLCIITRHPFLGLHMAFLEQMMTLWRASIMARVSRGAFDSVRCAAPAAKVAAAAPVVGAGAVAPTPPPRAGHHRRSSSKTAVEPDGELRRSLALMSFEGTSTFNEYGAGDTLARPHPSTTLTWWWWWHRMFSAQRYLPSSQHAAGGAGAAGLPGAANSTMTSPNSTLDTPRSAVTEDSNAPQAMQEVNFLLSRSMKRAAEVYYKCPTPLPVKQPSRRADVHNVLTK